MYVVRIYYGANRRYPRCDKEGYFEKRYASKEKAQQGANAARNLSKIDKCIKKVTMRKTKSHYQENPSREANTAIGAGVGVLLGALVLGLPGAILGGGAGAVIGASRRPTRLLENQRTCPRGTQVQTLLFDRRSFTRAQAISWARRNGYSAHKVDTTPNKYRIRQKSPGSFTRDSFRTISLSDRVEAVIGCPRS